MPLQYIAHIGYSEDKAEDRHKALGGVWYDARTMQEDAPRPFYVVFLAALLASGGVLAFWLAAETKVVNPPTAEKVMQAAQLESYPAVAYMEDSTVCAGLGLGTSGCFSSATPNIIYIAHDLPASIEKSVILHELAHYYQHQNGLPLDECHADELAALWGANPEHSGYKDECR